MPDPEPLGPRYEFPKARAIAVAAVVAVAGYTVKTCAEYLLGNQTPPATTASVSILFEGLQQEAVHRHAYDPPVFPDEALELGRTGNGKVYCLLTNIPGPAIDFDGFSLHHLLDEECDGQADASIEGRMVVGGETRANLQRTERAAWPSPFTTWADTTLRTYLGDAHAQEQLRNWRAMQR